VKVPEFFPSVAPVVPLAAGVLFAVYQAPGYLSRLMAVAIAVSCVLAGLGLLVPAVFPASTAPLTIGIRVSLFLRTLQRSRITAMLLALGLGLFLGVNAHFKVETLAGSASPGFVQPTLHPASKVDVLGYEGRLLSDPRKSASGMDSYEVLLTSVLASDGGRASASGRLMVYARPGKKGNRVFVRGQQLRILFSQDTLPARTGAGVWVDALAPRTAFVDAAGIEAISQPLPLEAVRSTVRASMLTALSRAGGRAGPLLIALIVGVRDDLDEELALDFRLAGCVHILSLSGQHVGIVASIVALALGFAIGPYRARAVACVLVGLYLFIVGGSPSVLRAVLMFWISGVALFSDRPQKPLAILAVAFVIVVMVKPETAHTISFQLSYLAMAGLAIFVPVYGFILRRWLPPVFAGVLATGFGAMATTAPLSLIVFGTLNPVAPLTSALAGPLVASLMYAGIAGALIISMVPVLQPVAVFVSEILWRALGTLMGLAASLPSIALTEQETRVGAAVIVAVVASMVYAWPYVSYLAESRRRASTGKLRLPFGTFRPAGAAGPGNAQKIRPELPDKRQYKTSRRRPLRYGAGDKGMGNRPGDRVDDLRSAAGGVAGFSIRD